MNIKEEIYYAHIARLLKDVNTTCLCFYFITSKAPNEKFSIGSYIHSDANGFSNRI